MDPRSVALKLTNSSKKNFETAFNEQLRHTLKAIYSRLWILFDFIYLIRCYSISNYRQFHYLVIVNKVCVFISGLYFWLRLNLRPSITVPRMEAKWNLKPKLVRIFFGRYRTLWFFNGNHIKLVSDKNSFCNWLKI